MRYGQGQARLAKWAWEVDPEDYDRGDRWWKHDVTMPLCAKLRRSEEREARPHKKSDEFQSGLVALRTFAWEVAAHMGVDSERLRDIRSDIRQGVEGRSEWALEMAR